MSNGIPSRRGNLYLTLRVPGGNGPLQLCDILRSADLGVSWTLVAAGVFACKLASTPRSPTAFSGWGTASSRRELRSSFAATPAGDVGIDDQYRVERIDWKVSRSRLTARSTASAS
jgi:hypothetical protein